MKQSVKLQYAKSNCVVLDALGEITVTAHLMFKGALKALFVLFKYMYCTKTENSVCGR